MVLTSLGVCFLFQRRKEYERRLRVVKKKEKIREYDRELTKNEQYFPKI